MDNDKIRINGKDFYVIPECKKEGHTLCVAAEPWGKSIWGESTWGKGTNGQKILDAADNRNSISLTYNWYDSLPEDPKKAMLTVRVTTNDYDKAGEGVLEQTEMFVPSFSEWEKVPQEIRKMIANNDCLWSRSYYDTAYGVGTAWFVGYDGNICDYGDQVAPCDVVPAFYLEDNLLKSLIRKSDSGKADKRLEDIQAGKKTFLHALDEKMTAVSHTAYSSDLIQNEGIKAVLLNMLKDVREMADQTLY